MPTSMSRQPKSIIIDKILLLKECNARKFEDIERPIDLLKSLLARTLFEWSRI